MDTKVKHTDGPWKFTRTHGLSADRWYVITDANGYGPIMEVGGKDNSGQIAEAKHLITDPETIEANARLIAAAPELLEALKGYEQWEADLLMCHESWDENDFPRIDQDLWDKLLALQAKRKAAIAKAEGA